MYSTKPNQRTTRVASLIAHSPPPDDDSKQAHMQTHTHILKTIMKSRRACMRACRRRRHHFQPPYYKVYIIFVIATECHLKRVVRLSFSSVHRTRFDDQNVTPSPHCALLSSQLGRWSAGGERSRTRTQLQYDYTSSGTTCTPSSYTQILLCATHIPHTRLPMRSSTHATINRRHRHRRNVYIRVTRRAQ